MAVKQSIDLYLLNRGQSSRPGPDGAHILYGDIRDKDSVNRALGDMMFDVVVNWIAFTPEHIENDLELFRGRTDQYVFISSASVYQTPPVKRNEIVPLLPEVCHHSVTNQLYQHCRF